MIFILGVTEYICDRGGKEVRGDGLKSGGLRLQGFPQGHLLFPFGWDREMLGGAQASI